MYVYVYMYIYIYICIKYSDSAVQARGAVWCVCDANVLLM
jgi:hypothetical protein